MCEKTTKNKDHELALAEKQLRDLDGIPQWLKDALLRPVRPTPPEFWSPPDDPDKPRLPYLPGLSTKIYHHLHERETSRPAISSTDYLANVTQSEAVVANPSAETPVFAENETAQLTITAPVAIGEPRRAQIASCSVTLLKQNGETATTFQALAKFYDPLYYNFQSDIGNHPQDCAYDADQNYKAEAAAYERLWKREDILEATTSAPKYYGSWIFWLPISIHGKLQTRSIRLILIEHLDRGSLEHMHVHMHPSGRSARHSQYDSSDSEEDPSDPVIFENDPIPGISKGPYSTFDDSRELYLKYIHPNIPWNNPAEPTGKKET